MKQDDYFVIAYKVLAYLYECLKQSEAVDKDLISPEGLDINEKYHNWIFKALHEEGRITGVYDIGGSNYVKISYSELAITEAGIIFLQENSGIERAKTFLKDLKAMIPGA